MPSFDSSIRDVRDVKRILVPTDFSTRSDRGLRRATLLARRASAEMVLVHVVDDDQPARLLRTAEREAGRLLNDLASTVREADGVACEARVLLGEPFQAIADVVAEISADLVVIGPHRRQALRDIFIGTTAERTIRQSSRPVLMANAVPAAPYRRVLVATDLSDSSTLAVRTALALGVLDDMDSTVLHVFDAPAKRPISNAAMTMDQLKAQIARQEQQAGSEVRNFLNQVGFRATRSLAQPVELSVAETIRKSAGKHRAELVVVGTHGTSGAERFLLGSVAEEVLCNSQVDVLVVPRVRGSEAAGPGAA